MYRSIPSFISYAQTRAQILSQTELEQTSCYLQVRKYRSLTKRSLPKSHADQLTFASCNEKMLIGLEFKSTRTIRQQHSHTDIICLRGGSKVVCARLCSYRCPDTSSAGSRSRIRATVSGDTVTAFCISAVVAHALCFVSRGVCNLCASDNPRSGR